MEFETVYKHISRRLRYLAQHFAGYNGPFDQDDLYQEMCMFLWDKYKDGVPLEENEAYVTKACEFYIRNYLRTHQDKYYLLSLEEPIGEDGCSLKELLPDRKEALDISTDRGLIIDHILNNGFTEREKDVFRLLLEGWTVREAGERLGISHVRVVKLKKNLINKYRGIIKTVTKN